MSVKAGGGRPGGTGEGSTTTGPTSTKLSTPQLCPPVYTPTLPSELTFVPIPTAKVLTKADREEAAKRIDQRIREQASKVVMAAVRYRDDDQSDMTAEEIAIAEDAKEPSKEAAVGLSMALKVFESFQKKESADERPQLAIQINFGGAPTEYPRIKVEE